MAGGLGARHPLTRALAGPQFVRPDHIAQLEPTAADVFAILDAMGVEPELETWRRSAWTRGLERLPDTLGGLHFLAFAILMFHRLSDLMAQSALTGSRRAPLT